MVSVHSPLASTDFVQPANPPCAGAEPRQPPRVSRPEGAETRPDAESVVALCAEGRRPAALPSTEDEPRWPAEPVPGLPAEEAAALPVSAPALALEASELVALTLSSVCLVCLLSATFAPPIDIFSLSAGAESVAPISSAEAATGAANNAAATIKPIAVFFFFTIISFAILPNLVSCTKTFKTSCNAN